MVTERVDILIRMQGAPRIKRGLDRIKKSTDATRKALALMRNVLVTVAAVRVIGQFVELIDSFTIMQNRLKLVTTGMENLVAIQDQLFVISQETGTAIESNVNLFSRMARATDNLGISQDKLIKITRGINQALVLSGATAQEARNGLIQFSQGLASGTLRGDELRSVVEQFPELARIIGKEFGVAGGKLASFAKENDGILKTDRILKAISDALPDLDRRFKETTDTISRGFVRVSNAFTIFLGQLGQTTGFSAGFTSALNTLSKNFILLFKTLAAVTTALIALYIPNIISATKGTGIFSKIVKAASVQLGFFRKAILIMPFQTILAGLAAIGIALALFSDDISASNDSNVTFGNVFSGIVDKMVNDFARLVGSAKKTEGALGKFFDFIVTRSKEGFTNFVEKSLNILGFFTSSIGFVGKTVKNLFNELFVKPLTNENPFIEQFLKDLSDSFGKTAVEAANLKKIFDTLLAEEPDDLVIPPPTKVIEPFELSKTEKSSFKKLRDALDPLGSAIRKLATDTKILQLAEKAGLITQKERLRLTKLLFEATEEARNPVLALRDALDKEEREASLSVETTDRLAKATELVNEVVKKNKRITEEQRDSLIKNTVARLKAIDTIKRQRDLLLELKGPEEDLNKRLKDLNALLEANPGRRIQINKEIVKAQVALSDANRDNSKTGLSLTETLRRQRRELNGVGNATVLAAEKINVLNEDLQEGIITLQEYEKALIKVKLESLATATDAASGFERGLLKIQQTFTDTAGLAESALVNAFQAGEDALAKFVETGKLDFSSLINSILKDLIKLSLRTAITGPLAKAIGGIGQGGGGFAGSGKGDTGVSSGGGFLGSLFGGGGGSALGGLFSGFKLAPSFEHGGQFTVGGQGGVDSQLVRFNATPGEEVTVTRKGKEKESESKIRPINVIFNITTPDADSFRASQGQIGATVSAALSRHSRRNN